MPRVWRWILITGLVLVSVSAVATVQGDTPARELVRQALDLIRNRYRGAEQIDFENLRVFADTRLETACGTNNSCSYETGGEVIDAITERIGDGHTFRLSPNRFRQYIADNRNSTVPMLGLKFDGIPDANALVVTRVKRESPALKAGLQRGDVIWQINERPLETFNNATAAMEFITALEFKADPIQLTVSTRGEPRRVLTLTPEAMQPWLPVYTLRPDGVAFITFFQFVTRGQIASRVQELMEQVRDSGIRAVVVDVRGSGGGDGFEMARSVEALLDTSSIQFRPFSVGNSVAVDPTQTSFRRFERSEWNGQIIVLVNRLSRSAAEYLAAGLQPSGRVTVIGEPTAGVLNSSTQVFNLVDGGALAVTASARRGAPNRVIPTILQTDDMAVLSRGRDLVLEIAQRMLKR
jgi:carboxyl-terminal processing protease